MNGRKKNATLTDNDLQEPKVILNLVRQWIQDTDTRKICGIIRLDYGWEGWLQADLGLYLAVKLGADKGVLREQLAYGDQRRVDLVLVDRGENPMHFFEFKCKSLSQTGSQFGQGLLSDFKKVDDIVPSGARKWVIGFWVDDEKTQNDPVTFNGIGKWTSTTVDKTVNILCRAWCGGKFQSNI